MNKLLVLADDFTGAMDTGVQFAKMGISTAIITTNPVSGDTYPGLTSGAEAVVIDLESRHISMENAADRVRRAVMEAKNRGTAYFYKKTDSTLRGNIGSELNALMDAIGTDELMFIPAFPKTGRTTVNGSHYVNGILLNETAYAKDPLNPVEDSYIPDIIKNQAAVETIVINAGSRDDLVTGILSIPSSTRTGIAYTASCASPADGYRKSIAIFDAQNDDDLANIGKALKLTGKLTTTAGCAGFAEVLPGLLDLNLRHGMSLRDILLREKRQRGRGMLIICGSVNELSRRQVRFAESKGFMVITLKLHQILNESYVKSDEFLNLIPEIRENIDKGRSVILKTAELLDSSDETADIIKYTAKSGIDRGNISLVISRNIGQLTKIVLDELVPDVLVVFGGDTAISIMEALGCHMMTALGEITPGIAVSEITAGRRRMKMISKAGGFGNEEVLTDIEKFLEGVY